MISLTNGNMSVTIQLGGEDYQGCRFDHGGIVTAMEWEGHSFCGVEHPRPGIGSGGIGLCWEYGLDTPCGFDETPIGSAFLKIGVGWLDKDTEQYDHMHNYPVQALCTKLERQSGDSVSFVFDSGVQNGWGARSRRNLRLTQKGLEISALLENIGEKPLCTNEYGHNFLAVDNQPVAAGTRLDTGNDAVNQQVEALLAGDDEEYYIRIDDTDFLESFTGWTLTAGGQSIREEWDFQPCRFAVWGTSWVVSPECFVPLTLETGETTQWTRRYSFEK